MHSLLSLEKIKKKLIQFRDRLLQIALKTFVRAYFNKLVFVTRFTPDKIISKHVR